MKTKNNEMTIKIIGPQGSGKSTIINFIYTKLRDEGYGVGFTRSKPHEMICNAENKIKCRYCGQNIKG